MDCVPRPRVQSRARLKNAVDNYGIIDGDGLVGPPEAIHANVCERYVRRMEEHHMRALRNHRRIFRIDQNVATAIRRVGR